MNPEHLTAIRQRLEKLYAMSGVNSHNHVLEKIQKLDGFVDFSVLPDGVKDLPEFDSDERLLGLYLNSQDNFLLVTTKALHWRQNKFKTESYPHELNRTVELDRLEDMLSLLIVTDSGKRTLIPLVHDDPQLHLNKDTIYDDSYVSINEIVKYDSEMIQVLPEICDWLMEGHPFDSELLEIDVDPKILKSKEATELLYSILDITRESCSDGRQSSTSAHPAIAHLSGIENLVFTDTWLEYLNEDVQGEDLKDLAVYFNDESNYFILGSESITIVEDNEKRSILYRTIDTIELDLESSSINLKSDDRYLAVLPVVSIGGGTSSAEKIAKFLVLMSTKENIDEINSKGDLLRFIINQYKRIPYCEDLSNRLENDIPNNLSMDGIGKEEFFRLVALVITRPYV